MKKLKNIAIIDTFDNLDNTHKSIITRSALETKENGTLTIYVLDDQLAEEMQKFPTHNTISQRINALKQHTKTKH